MFFSFVSLCKHFILVAFIFCQQARLLLLCVLNFFVLFCFVWGNSIVPHFAADEPNPFA